MKIYDKNEHKVVYDFSTDLYFTLEEEYMELLEVLANARLNGHNRHDQWMMKMEIKMKELLDCMLELEREIQDAIDKPILN